MREEEMVASLCEEDEDAVGEGEVIKDHDMSEESKKESFNYIQQ
jgi:hypothetical protein